VIQFASIILFHAALESCWIPSVKKKVQLLMDRLIVSDGAPVDDATLAANDLEILDRHLREVITSIAHASDIRLGAVGLEFDVSRYYPEFVIISSTDEMANRLVPFVASLFEDRPILMPAPRDAAGDEANS
jgi:cobaltochelatase CobT